MFRPLACSRRPLEEGPPGGKTILTCTFLKFVVRIISRYCSYDIISYSPYMFSKCNININTPKPPQPHKHSTISRNMRPFSDFHLGPPLNTQSIQLSPPDRPTSFTTRLSKFFPSFNACFRLSFASLPFAARPAFVEANSTAGSGSSRVGHAMSRWPRRASCWLLLGFSDSKFSVLNRFIRLAY